MSLSERQMIRAAYQTWGADQATDNKAELERLKILLPIVMDEVCTDRQKEYIYDYFAKDMTYAEIADVYGVTKSTVWKTVKVGMNRIYQHMKYASPMLLNSEDLEKKVHRIFRKLQQNR